MFTIGTREHAERLTAGRSARVHDIMQWLTFSHLPESLQAYSRVFYWAAEQLLDAIATDSAELERSLDWLLEAKDSAVRAGIRDQQGRAGSIPRPATVVNPPTLSDEA